MLSPISRQNRVIKKHTNESSLRSGRILTTSNVTHADPVKDIERASLPFKVKFVQYMSVQYVYTRDLVTSNRRITKRSFIFLEPLCFMKFLAKNLALEIQFVLDEKIRRSENTPLKLFPNENMFSVIVHERYYHFQLSWSCRSTSRWPPAEFLSYPNCSFGSC